MQVFKTALRIIRTKKSLLIYILIPIAMTMAYMGNTPQSSERFTQSPITFAIQNFDQKNPLSQALVDVMSHNNNLVPYPTDAKELRNKLFYTQIEYTLTIPENFFDDYAAYVEAGEGTALTAPQLLRVESAAQKAQQMNHIIGRFLTVVSTKLVVDPSQDKQILGATLVEELTQDTKVHVVRSTQEWNIASVDIFFRFSSYGIMSTIIFMSAYVYLAFRDRKVLPRQIASPTSYSQLNLGIGLSQIVCTLVVVLIYTSVSYLYFGSNMLNTVGLLAIANLALFALVALSLGTFTATVLKSENSITAIATIVPLALSFFGGSFIPLQYLSEPVRQIAVFLPTYWYTKSLDEFAKLNGADVEGLKAIGGNFLILAAFGLSFAITSLGISHYLNRSTGENITVSKRY